MSKLPLLSQTNQRQSLEDLTENPFFEWLSTNKRSILIGIAVLFASLVVGYRFAANRSLKAESDYFQAQTEFSRFQEKSLGGDSAQAMENFAQLETLLNRHPELQAKYDGLVAQNLVIDNEPAKAQVFADRTFKRVQSDGVGFYEDFSRTTLLISKGEYQEAAIQAKKLKDQLQVAPTSEFGPQLYVFNLIRLAFLYQQLNQPQEELATWNELENYKGNVDAVLAAQQLFKEGQTSLSHFVNERKKLLNQ